MAEEVVTWVDPVGVETPLNVEWDVDGRFAPEYEFITDTVPGRPGQIVREVRHNTRPVSMALWIGPYADDVALRTALRKLAKAMDPVRGPGRLRIQSPIGDTRDLPCYANLSMPERLGDTSGVNVQRASVTFTAYGSPYWEDPSDVQQVFTRGETVSFFPIFPLRLTSSEVFRDSSADNPGDVDAWPVWEIEGPGNSPVLWNLSQDKKLSLPSLSIGSDEAVVIDTRPGIKSITHSDGSNLFPLLEQGSSLWSLEPGVNSIRIEMSAAVTESSRVTLRYRPRYLSP